MLAATRYANQHPNTRVAASSLDDAQWTGTRSVGLLRSSNVLQSWAMSIVSFAPSISLLACSAMSRQAWSLEFSVIRRASVFWIPNAIFYSKQWLSNKRH